MTGSGDSRSEQQRGLQEEGEVAFGKLGWRGEEEGWARKAVFAELDLAPLSSPVPITGLSILGISSPPF